MNTNEYLSIIEGMIFLSVDEGLSIKQIASALGVSKKEALDYMSALIKYYQTKEVKGFDIVNFGGYYKMVTLEKHKDYYRQMIKDNTHRLSKSALETLAIVAYYQPITRVHIEEIRGVGCESMIRKLVAKALIKEVGREDSPGKPILYGVTDTFMDAFNLASLDELPELQEVTSSFDENDLFDNKYREEDIVDPKEGIVEEHKEEENEA